VTNGAENPDPLALVGQIIADLRQAMAHIQAATAWAISAQASLSKPVEPDVEHPVQPPLNTRQTREALQAEHRRAHRSGRPGKIEGDPDLEAFILARIATLTFDQIIAAIHEHFPSDRQARRSALHRWRRQCETRGLQPQSPETT
jgi:hypothetical protein